jgi:hypothetical protein
MTGSVAGQPRVLVSGTADLVDRVAAELRRRDATVTPVTDLAELPAACAAAGPEAFDSYLQLPSTFSASGDTAIQRVHHFYANGVLARFAALDAAVPSLTPTARLTFVMGQLPPEAATPDDREARQSLTRVLAHAARADRRNGELTVRFLAAGTAPADVAYVALGGDFARRQLMDRLSELSYADWRVELLGLATMET